MWKKGCKIKQMDTMALSPMQSETSEQKGVEKGVRCLVYAWG